MSQSLISSFPSQATRFVNICINHKSTIGR